MNAFSDVTPVYDAALVADKALQTSNSSQAQKQALGDASVRKKDRDLKLVETGHKAGLVSRHRISGGSKNAAKDEVYDNTGFLESAGVSRFSMCFNDDGTDGALRLNPPAAARTL